ncbi:hypothetical protein PROFUN_08348 [Planoprotostelium fungivorum]|uniref:Uncharacterized protein n=1 Tax=Planoprotostelium fungivorum TaxID=1890364 RepID=A0A2P6NI61_9EUKA|nr:hypothetical protein PROFUN_08348 [Planoprotostelium fungivorum]
MTFFEGFRSVLKGRTTLDDAIVMEAVRLLNEEGGGEKEERVSTLIGDEARTFTYRVTVGDFRHRREERREMTLGVR